MSKTRHKICELQEKVLGKFHKIPLEKQNHLSYHINKIKYIKMTTLVLS